MFFKMKVSPTRLTAPAAKAPLIPYGEVNTPENFQHRVEHDLYYVVAGLCCSTSTFCCRRHSR